LIDIGGHSLLIGVPRAEVPDWALAVLEQGRRDAAYVDTGYLRALVDPRDSHHAVVREHWRVNKTVAYTSSLVASEATRQLAKAKGVDQHWRWDKVESVKRLMIDDRSVIVCSPPRDVVLQAMAVLVELQRSLIRLGLCDCVTLLMLDVLRHRRVLGFDDHLNAVGASLEPV
jgi:predicted nucleic acid-binding protein